MHKKIKRIITLLLIASMGLGLFFDFNYSKAAEETSSISGTIEVAMHKNEELMSPYIKAFENKYPNVTVKFSHYDNYEGSMAQRVEDNDLPDVFFVPGSISYDMYDQYLYPLGTMEEFSQKYNYMEKGIVKEGKVYGIPSFAYLYGFIYNKRILAEAGITVLPTTTEEFLKDCKLIKDHTSATPFVTNYNDDWALGYWETFPFIEMNGNNSYRYTKYLNTANPFSEGSSHYTVYKLLYDMVLNGYVEPDLSSSGYGNGGYKLATGEAAFMCMGSWAFLEIHGMAEADNLGFMPFPNNVNGKQYATVGTDYCYAISSATDNYPAAKAYLDFMLENSGYAYNTGNISIVKNDAFPKYISEMDDVVMLYDSYAGMIDYDLIAALKTNIEPGSSAEIKRIIEAGAGMSNESFDSIMEDWNSRWESGRPEGYVVTDNASYDASVIVSDEKVIKLSAIEQDFIKKNPNLKIAYLNDHAPFSFEKDSEFSGLSMELCSLFEKSTTIQLEEKGYDSIDEIYDALKNKDVDMAIGISGAKRVDVLYSSPYFEVPMVSVTRESLDISNLSEYIQASATSVVDALRQIENKEADYYICDFYTASYYIAEQDFQDLILTPYSGDASLYIAFSDDVNTSLIALVNKCILALSENELQIQLYKYLTPEKAVTLDRLIKTNPALFFVILLVVFGTILGAVLIVLFHLAKTNAVKEFSMKKYSLLSELADEYFFEVDCKKMKLHFDSKFESTFGFPKEVNISKYKEEESIVQEFMEKVNYALMDKAANNNIMSLTKQDSGETVAFRIILSSIKDEHDSKPVYVVGKMQNVQKEIEQMESAQAEATTDSLTKIYNRRGFYDALPEVASQALFIVLDCDNFKGVNDTLGHAGGDMVLSLVAEAMKEYLGEDAICGRYGGDEFVAMLSQIDYELADLSVQRLVKAMDRTVSYMNINHPISISVGGVYFSGNVQVSKMFDFADSILYEKKKNGKNGYMIRKM